jgi:DNA repair exonuclease SbcCD ATPase subunit
MGRKVKIRRKNESMAYSGSLIQQNYGESIEKGYLIWDVENRSHERRVVLNDYGFAKLDVALGESLDERIENIKFSHNKKKTKVYIVWEDYEENYSVEKENQVIKKVKDKFGCEVVKVDFRGIIKEITVDDSEKEETRPKTSEELMVEFIKNGTFDCDDDLMNEIKLLHKEVNLTLGLKEEKQTGSKWDINKVEISNLFMFPVKPTVIDFDEVGGGIIGIFGENYNGKSNVIKSIVWGLYKETIGDIDSKYLINIYTDSNKGYIKLWLTIDDVPYLIVRTVKTTKKKDGSTSNSYSVEYKKLEFEYDEEGNLDAEKWENEKSDEKTAEQNEVQRMVENSLGSFEDFVRVSLRIQDSKDDYLSLKQQPKNDLFAKYIGLEPYRLRYEYANETFKDIKKKQKELGNILETELAIQDVNKKIEDKKIVLEASKAEKEKYNTNKETAESQKLELTKKLEKLEPVKIDDESRVVSLIEQTKKSITTLESEIADLENWLGSNFKKELPFDANESLDTLNKNLSNEQELFKNQKQEFVKIQTWINENPKKEIINIEGIDSTIKKLTEDIANLKAKLITFKGKSCPTCGTVKQKAEPEKETECLELIKSKEAVLKSHEQTLKDSETVNKHNQNVDNNIVKLENLKQSLINKKEKIDNLKAKIELFKKSEDIINHNKEVDSKAGLLKGKKVNLDSKKSELQELNDNLVKVKSNKDKKKANELTQDKIDELDDMLKAYKLAIYNLDKQITDLNGDVRVYENEIVNLNKNLNKIKDAEKEYKKYSIYLQAMHRDGIPTLIIRKKLPIINHIINAILKDVVDFNIKLNITPEGNIIETFFFGDDEFYSLPLSSSSGAQKFVTSIAIQEALHYISSLTKPTFKIIDEGFGTLSNKLTGEITNMLSYLKNKYKMVLVITHKNEIKDFAEHIIEAVKVKEGIPQEVLDRVPVAGTTKLMIS